MTMMLRRVALLTAFLLVCFSYRGGAFSPLALNRRLSASAGSNNGVGSGIAFPQHRTYSKGNDDIEEDLCFQFVRDYFEGNEVVEENEVIVEALREVLGKKEAWDYEDLEARVLKQLQKKGIGDFRFCDRLAAAFAARAEMESKSASAGRGDRLVGIDFEIRREFRYDFDLRLLLKKIEEELFGWYEVPRQQKKYFAPYFPIVQSSGMGKTKLMLEAKLSYARAETTTEKTVCILLYCQHARTSARKVPTGFDGIFPIPLGTSVEARETIGRRLDGLLEERDCERVVLLFDESQHLLKNDDAYAFRVIRRWLKESRHKKVCAIFAGTTSRLTHFYKDQLSDDSRDPSQHYIGAVATTNLISPFYHFTTIGLERHQKVDAGKRMTEYDKAVRYGRPLFELIRRKTKSGRLPPGKEKAILKRMLLSRSTEDEAACFSVLATRVQMGQVAYGFASDLVSRGYASLTYVSEKRSSGVADICFFPDPVLARLAMLLMVGKNPASKQQPFQEHCDSPEVWTERASRFFFQGLCRPPKGDVGEIGAALFMLFCGDKLRSKKDPKLKTFSVSLCEWFDQMEYANSTSLEAHTVAKAPTKQFNETQSVNGTTEDQEELTLLRAGQMDPWKDASISFIQVCRDFLRPTNETIQSLLPLWYESGRAIYAYPMCPGVDIIAPVRLNQKGEDKYVPLVVSVKHRISFTPSEQGTAVQAMKNFTVGTLGCSRGVGILLLLGLESKKDRIFERVDDAEGKFLCYVIEVPRDDVFGISKFLDVATIGGGEEAEVYLSHAEIPPVGDYEGALRVTGKASVKTYLSDMLRSMNFRGRILLKRNKSPRVICNEARKCRKLRKS